MRQPAEIERLYIDCDSFFASVEQQVHPHLRGKPVGVVPFKDAQHTCVIACSREAKLRGVKNVMGLEEARERCPDIIFVPQSPDLYRRAHNTVGNLRRHPHRCGQIHRRVDLPRLADGTRRSARARFEDQKTDRR